MKSKKGETNGCSFPGCEPAIRPQLRGWNVIIRSAGHRTDSVELVLLFESAQKAKQRQSAGDRQEQKLLDDGTPPEVFLARQLLLCLGLKHQHRRKFLKIDSAAIALDSVILKMMAGGTFVANRMMTTPAELNLLGVFLSAFLAVHSRIIVLSGVDQKQ